ncbi:MAG: virulence RhuM family protein [Candidatus Margulisbacteria bacterium]|nr:virulence RhuM family protein [Candidatus Margulisiibacteriota bacterium]
MKNKKQNNEKNQIIIYQANDGTPGIEVRFQGETTWLTQAQFVNLFGSSKANISEHIKHIFEEGELERDLVVRKFRTTAADGKTYEIEHYNLDMTISLGYRVKSSIATRFRIWATARLREYIVKGFAMDDERLKNLGGGNYWKELLDRIRDIRSSEKVLYRQVLDLYATSIDYNPKASESIEFFKVVQNKLHYAAHGHTAAEVIAARADAGKQFMGLLTFSGAEVARKDIGIAKNYLTEGELKKLNNIVSAYFDLAEVKAMDHEPMRMSDWIAQLDRLIQTFDGKILGNAGSISHEKAMQKAESEYKKYQSVTISAVERAYLETLKKVGKKLKKGKKDNKQ